MIRFLPLTLILQLSFGFAINAQAQLLWPLSKALEFVPLESTIADVERVYGKGVSKNNPYFVTYSTQETRVSVEFATGNCQTNAPLWNTPEWTVTEVTYSFIDERPSLMSLISNASEFRVRRAGDVLNHVEYYDERKGISILYDQNGEGVMDIVVRPSADKIRKFQCKLKIKK